MLEYIVPCRSSFCACCWNTQFHKYLVSTLHLLLSLNCTFTDFSIIGASEFLFVLDLLIHLCKMEVSNHDVDTAIFYLKLVSRPYSITIWECPSTIKSVLKPPLLLHLGFSMQGFLQQQPDMGSKLGKKKKDVNETVAHLREELLHSERGGSDMTVAETGRIDSAEASCCNPSARACWFAYGEGRSLMHGLSLYTAKNQRCLLFISWNVLEECRNNAESSASTRRRQEHRKIFLLGTIILNIAKWCSNTDQKQRKEAAHRIMDR
ncbi:hypothetical protein ZIOFF_050344 [Zingiber officinale]|uniref:Uncharacterized protein n=1 Tax=Zingiber officinale TaxID=94328 RepID=A0A8J5FRH4_ZINOF|nr:hypothetical protein ZIOFF_050344 [Zingiber officinale]